MRKKYNRNIQYTPSESYLGATNSTQDLPKINSIVLKDPSLMNSNSFKELSVSVVEAIDRVSKTERYLQNKLH